MRPTPVFHANTSATPIISAMATKTPRDANQNHTIRPADVITLAALALLAIGVIMVASAGMTVSPDQSHSPVTITSILTAAPARYMALAFAILLIARATPIRALLTTPPTTRLIPLLLPLAVALLLLVYVPAVRYEQNGAARWIQIPGFALTFQPSELAKWSLPILIAWWAAKRPRALRTFSAGVAPPLVATAAIAAIIAHQDLGTAVLVFAAASITLIAAGARLTHFALLVAPLAAAGATLATIAEPYRVQRILTFLNPYQDPAGDGYHMIQSLTAIAAGGPTGRGLGYGLQKFGYLPEDRTDFLFAIIAEELGLAGVATVLTLYAALLLACLTVIKREQQPLLKLAALGITTTLALQTLINLFVVTGMAPTKGIALPLLSHGGTGWVLTAASLGFIASIDRSRPNKPDTNTATANNTSPEPTPTPSPA